MKYQIGCILFSIASISYGQLPPDAKSPDEVLGLSASRQSTVLLLGAWHFDYPGLDSHKIANSNQIDILSPNRQKELEEVLDKLGQFNPSVICLESDSQQKLDQRYQDFLDGKGPVSRSEVVQVGFKLGQRLRHKRVYAVDAGAWGQEAADDPAIKSMWEAVRNNAKSLDPLQAAYNRWYSYQDQYAKAHALREALLLHNDDDVLNRMLGQYYIGTFKNPNPQVGPDKLSIWWINRNLRIFHKILQVASQPGMRILVVFGQGHIPLLRDAFRDSPEFRLVRVSDVLR